MTPQLHRFHRRYPDIELLVDYGATRGDLVRDGIDCAIRVGKQQDSALIGKLLGTLQMVTVATPGYLERSGTPVCLSELRLHRVVRYVPNGARRSVGLAFASGCDIELNLRGSIAFNCPEACLSYGMKGTGIFQAPKLLVGPHIKSGALVEVLSQFPPQAYPVSIVYPQKRYVAAKLRAFVEWSMEVFRGSLLDGLSDTTVPTASATGH